MLFINTLRQKDLDTFDMIDLLITHLEIDNFELARLMVGFASDELDNLELAKALALEYMLHEEIEIDSFTSGMAVYDDLDFFNYIVSIKGVK